MSEPVQERYVPPGDEDYLEATWQLKEHIRHVDGVLEQGQTFFRQHYNRYEVYLLLDHDDPVAFAVVRADGYVPMLGVHPMHRRRGLGRRLVRRIAETHDHVTCHTRADDEIAVAFYTALGFAVEARVKGYYRDGADAYHLELSEESTLRLKRITDLLGRS